MVWDHSGLATFRTPRRCSAARCVGEAGGVRDALPRSPTRSKCAEDETGGLVWGLLLREPQGDMRARDASPSGPERELMSVGGDASTAPPLTVVVATTRCWPAANVCLREMLPQARAVGAELILADGHGCGFDPELDPDVVWLRRPGVDCLTRHARALGLARGDVVAITEDHARPDPNWCEAVWARIGSDRRPTSSSARCAMLRTCDSPTARASW
jgi:hypothetical protein